MAPSEAAEKFAGAMFAASSVPSLRRPIPTYSNSEARPLLQSWVPLDPVCVVSKRGPDGVFRKILQYNPHVRVKRGQPQPLPTVEGYAC